jgi:hypothetical protein
MPEGLHHLAVNQQSLVECDSSSGENRARSLSNLVTPSFLIDVRRMPMELHAFNARGSGFESRWLHYILLGAIAQR